MILSCNVCFSQFAIVHDADGYVNVRNTPKTGKNISEKLDNGFVVYAFEPQSNWINVDCKKNGKELHGYIYKDKINYISDYKNIPMQSNLNGKVILADKAIKIEITETQFIKANHKLKFLSNSPSILEKIDNLTIFGTDGNIPKREYRSITVEIENEKIAIPASALQNLYEPTLEYTAANYDEVNNILYLHSSNSDGAGGYEILWIVENNKFKSRVEAYAF